MARENDDNATTTRPRPARLARLTIGLVLVATLFVCLSHAARTRAVLGPFVAGQLERAAVRYGLGLEVATVRPQGLLGLRLERVALQTVRGGHLVDARFDTVDVYPSLKTLLNIGGARLAAVDVTGGVVTIEPYVPAAPAEADAEHAAADDAPPGDATPDDSNAPQLASVAPTPAPHAPTTTATNTATNTASMLAATVRVGIYNTYMRTGAGAHAALEALDGVFVEAATLELDTSAGALPREFESRGELASGGLFSAELLATEASSEALCAGGGRQLRIRADGVAASELVEHDWPFDVRANGASVCLLPGGGLPATGELLALEDLVITSRHRHLPGVFHTPQLRVVRGADTGHLEAQIARGTLELQRSRDERVRGRPFELRGAVARWHATRGLELRGWVHEPMGGRLRAELVAGPALRAGQLELWYEAFDADLLLAHSNLARYVPRLVVDGFVRADFDLLLAHAAVELRTDLRAMHIHAPFLAPGEIVFADVGLEADALLDFGARSASLTAGKVAFGPSQPIDVRARLVDTRIGPLDALDANAAEDSDAPHRHWAFGATMEGRGLEPASLQRHLPEALIGVLREVQMEGTFDFALATSGHTAYPDSLLLDVRFGGDVVVLEDGDYIDVHRLKAAGTPPPRGVVHAVRAVPAADWTSYDDLPAYVPNALLAAEDASFFDHSGLDWVGIRMAMIHNLREGSFERGGSTISQQLAKNLFLTHNRTLSRKLQEAFLTWRIESELGKERILELYLNVVDWGPGIHGIHQAARHYFEAAPGELAPVEMVLLAAMLPNPARFGRAVKAGYLPSSRLGKVERTLANMRFLDQLSWREYYAARNALGRGRVGRLAFEVCDDDATAPARPDGTPAPGCAEALRSTGSEADEMTFELDETVNIPVSTGWVPLTQ